MPSFFSSKSRFSVYGLGSAFPKGLAASEAKDLPCRNGPLAAHEAADAGGRSSPIFSSLP